VVFLREKLRESLFRKRGYRKRQMKILKKNSKKIKFTEKKSVGDVNHQVY